MIESILIIYYYPYKLKNYKICSPSVAGLALLSIVTTPLIAKIGERRNTLLYFITTDADTLIAPVFV